MLGQKDGRARFCPCALAAAAAKSTAAHAIEHHTPACLHPRQTGAAAMSDSDEEKLGVEELSTSALSALQQFLAERSDAAEKAKTDPFGCGPGALAAQQILLV